MRRFAFGMTIVACFALSVLADLPPPPPEAGFKRVPYEQVLKLGEDIAGYKFFPFQRLGLGGKETLGEELKLGKEKGVRVPSSSSPSVRTGVVAVPEKVWEELKSKEKVAKLLSRDNQEKLPAGIVVHETSGEIRDLPESDPRTKVENVITVTRDEKAGVKFTARETPAPPGTGKTSDASNLSPLATILAGISASLAVVILGVWYFRGRQAAVPDSAPRD